MATMNTEMFQMLLRCLILIPRFLIQDYNMNKRMKEESMNIHHALLTFVLNQYPSSR